MRVPEGPRQETANQPIQKDDPTEAKKGGGLRTGPHLWTTDLKDDDSTVGRLLNRGETGANGTTCHHSQPTPGQEKPS